jgi:hypothetical protein
LVTERDGHLAASWQADTQSPAYFDNCRAGLDDVRGLAGGASRHWL